ncbi:MAG: twin-arginine translocase TatA/TatE family subunit [Chloroflexi bacterium]|jgi:sec-independent protein translocase protein TatA|nr:twin-arginine translocase TatA/TatE family subunit [Chloroflexota bacterium]
MIPKLPGIWELVIILVIVLAIFGAGKLSTVGGALGKAIAGFRKASKEGLVDEKDDKKDSPDA